MFIPIFTLNTDKRVWGKDAQEFRYATSDLASLPSNCRGPRADVYMMPTLSRPERWENVPPGVQGLPGVWGNIMSFLGGSRACIGYHFATLE